MATALDRWDEEGGAQDVAWPLPYVERRVLECLGAALVSEWNDLPTDVQRRLFEHAASGKSHDATLLKTRIARFLHDHKDASKRQIPASAEGVNRRRSLTPYRRPNLTPLIDGV
jgi:hypothetical protein